MLYRTLSGTGLRVSLLGLGTGTRFGDVRRNPPAAATRLVRSALDLGINYFDTAAIYGEAESLLGNALAGVPRADFILATKFFPADAKGHPITPAELRVSVEESLRRLRLDTIDVLQIHGLRPHWLAPVMEMLGEELETLRRMGCYRFLGVSETIVEDPRHEMVALAAQDGRFRSALIGYNLLSPWAELTALPSCLEKQLGAVVMVAVGKALRDKEHLVRLIAEARERGEHGVTELAGEKSLGWLLDEHAPTLASAGCRFAASHPAVASVLAGTLNLDHLRENIAAVCAPPMPEAMLARIRSAFLRTNPEHWRPYDV